MNDGRTEPVTDWARHAIWWHLHPLTFLGAEQAAPAESARPVPPRLPRLYPWLDYLVELGCNGLALGPVFASGTHGYDTIDHFRVDPRLGAESDLSALFHACHERGVRVLLDGVFNHVGRDFGPFRDVLAHGAESAYASWFRLDFAAGGPDGFGYADFEGHRNLPALNHAEPAVVDYVVEVMTHWLARGADGWRLDAAYAVPQAFWRAVAERVRARQPRAWLLGEVIHGDYATFVQGSGLDSVTQYELWKAIWSSLNDRNFFELAWALKRHNEFADAFLPLTFIGNHDVTRIASRVDEPGHLALALVVLFTVAGQPSVYAGDEQAFRGVKYERAGGDDEIRPEFPAAPTDLAPYGLSTFRLHQDLIGLRRRHSWLTRSHTRVLHLDNTRLAYQAVDPDGDAGLTVLLNAGATAFDFAVAGRAHRVEALGWAIVE